MQIQIEILSCNVNVMPTAKGSYKMFDLAYKDVGSGKVSGRKVADFTIKEGKQLIEGAQPGTKLTIDMEKEPGKDGKEYWVWKKVTAGAAGNAPQNAGVASPRSTYETPEERAAKQQYIIRQSSIASAIALLKTEKNIPTVEDVLGVAQKFYDFVYQVNNEEIPE